MDYNEGIWPRKSLHRSRPDWKKLVKQRFTPEGKAGRVAKALAALHQEQLIKLSPEEWKWVAEDADLEDRS